MPTRAARSPAGLVPGLYQMGMTTPPFWDYASISPSAYPPPFFVDDLYLFDSDPRVGKDIF
jgi:hypothetical protein